MLKYLFNNYLLKSETIFIKKSINMPFAWCIQPTRIFRKGVFTINLKYDILKLPILRIIRVLAADRHCGKLWQNVSFCEQRNDQNCYSCFLMCTGNTYTHIDERFSCLSCLILSCYLHQFFSGTVFRLLKIFIKNFGKPPSAHPQYEGSKVFNFLNIFFLFCFISFTLLKQ